VKASLSQDGVELNERDFFKDSFTEEELRDLLGDTPPADVFSWRSPSARKLGLDRDTVSPDELVRLMVDEPRLIRRPLIQVEGRLIVGTDKKAMAEAFG
jgi:arsenate reductase-like glutaredoxin family protein